MIKQLELPKVYELHKERPEEKYRKFLGRPKLSYSALTSFMDDKYRGDFFSNYFLNIKDDGNVFSRYGNAVGDFISEDKDKLGLLSENDKKILREKIGKPTGAVYEKEIIIDRGSYILQGFLDRTIIEGNEIDVIDFKSGKIETKKAQYESDNYKQVDLYCYALDIEGLTIRDSGVIMIDRAGNGQEKYPLRLTGITEDIPKPYNREKTEKALEEYDYVAKQIEEYYRIFNKYLK